MTELSLSVRPGSQENRLEIATRSLDKAAMEAAPTTETDFATAIIASGIADEPVTHLVEGAMRPRLGRRAA
jgi:hypothetical protein